MLHAPVTFTCTATIYMVAIHSAVQLLQPQFMHLAQIWGRFQDDMVMLSVLSNLLLSLESFVRVYTLAVIFIYSFYSVKQQQNNV